MVGVQLGLRVSALSHSNAADLCDAASLFAYLSNSSASHLGKVCQRPRNTHVHTVRPLLWWWRVSLLSSLVLFL